MLLKSFFFSRPTGGAAIDVDVLARTAQRGAAQEPHWRETRLQEVIRPVPTDSVASGDAAAKVVPWEGEIGFIVELVLDGPVAMASASPPAWQSLLDEAGRSAQRLLSLDAYPNVPIPPKGAAADGGFRRAMLLRRAAATPDAFRDAWFGRHAALVARLPGIDGYLQDLTTARYDAEGRSLAYEDCAIDGVAQVCYGDEAAMNASYESPERAALRADGRVLLDRVTTLLLRCCMAR